MPTAAQKLKREQETVPSARCIGGKLGQEKLSPEAKSQRSSRAGTAVLLRFGQGQYAALGRLSAIKKRAKKAQAASGAVE